MALEEAAVAAVTLMADQVVSCLSFDHSKIMVYSKLNPWSASYPNKSFYTDIGF